VGRAELLLEALSGEKDARLFASEVVGDLVAFVQYPPQQRLVSGDPVADDEESGARAVPLQNLEDNGCRDGIGAVVDGEG
jgi:hypothetical protein